MARRERIAIGNQTLLRISVGAFLGAAAANLWPQPATPAPVVPQNEKAPAFDVVSVKEVQTPFLSLRPDRSGGRINWTTGLSHVIEYAYRLQPVRIQGAIPGDTDHIYSIAATTSPDATDDQIRVMFQSMLIDRFKMAAHHETRDVEGYSLKVARNGAKISPTMDTDPPPPLPDWMKGADPAQVEGRVVAISPRQGIVDVVARRVTISQFADSLQRWLDMTVTDETGLAGKFYFALRYARDDAGDNVDAPTIFVALRNTLGLQLEKHKNQVEILVVDHIESRPTEN